MSISIEDLRRLIFHENKTDEEIAKIYGISPNKVKKLIKTMPIPINKSKECNSCKNGGGRNIPPPENSGGMTFELTKD
jgi:hypothetical protein